jgi:hypothetical protein
MRCLNCNQDTNNPKYCSRSCAATFSNKLSAKRKKSKPCQKCGSLVLRKHRYCKDCRPFVAFNTYKTIGDIQRAAKYQISAALRSNARIVFSRTGKPRCCQICGYDKHVEICHIKAIKSFPITALVCEVNSPDNLVALCPNHHWELDRGMLAL